jgi:hypothetical protein
MSSGGRACTSVRHAKEGFMNRSVFHAAGLIAAGAVVWAPGSACAEETPSATVTSHSGGYSLNPGGPAEGTVTREYQSPDAELLATGAFLLGVSYAGSVIVAGTSDRPEDHRLFIPVAGPWMDLTHRQHCADRVCPDETADRVLLVANGLLQSVGALQIISSFLFPTKYTETRPIAKGVHVAPQAGIGMAGVTAYGAF